MKRTLDLYVQYGCGLSGPAGWINFDASPTLRLQRIPLIGRLLTAQRVRFPDNVKFGDVVRGLPLPNSSCKGIYASHVLEHLGLDEFHFALRETYRLLVPGGRFRLIVPDLASLAERYLTQFHAGDEQSSSQFMTETCLGVKVRPKGLKGLVEGAFGNSAHLWMWDDLSMKSALKEAGFVTCRSAVFGDSDDPKFALVEAPNRFIDAVALEAIK